MNELMMNDPTVTMSSREIADLTGKRHDNVLADIRKMLTDLDLNAPDFSGVYKDQQDIERPCFHLDRELSTTLVTGYDVIARNRIIKRWMELEAGRPQMTYLESLKALVVSIEAQEAAEKKVAQLSEALDREFGYVSILRAAMFVGVKETKFKWPMLKSASIKMGCPPKKVPSPRYPYQLLYPIAAFVECYPEYDFTGLKPDGVGSIKRLAGIEDKE